jgi:hypothetical protein
MEIQGTGMLARAVPSPNAGKNVTVRLWKPYAEAPNQVLVGEIVRENTEYLVVRGHLMVWRDGEADRVQQLEERIRWVPWSQIVVVMELPAEVKWRESVFYVDDAGWVQARHR